jgi:hypothetical protein
MSLNWKMPEDFNKKLIWNDANDGEIHTELHCLIFTCMHLLHNIDGEMTDDKLCEIDRRLRLLVGLDCVMKWSVGDEGDYRMHTVNLETVIRYWGLSTNCGHYSASKWNTRLMKISKSSQWDIKYAKEQALKNIAAFPDLTQPYRQYNELMDYNKSKAKEATDLAPTPAAP